MVKKVLACLLLLLMAASGAWASTNLWIPHHSIASITDGKADYSDARFTDMYFPVLYDDVPVTKELAKITGSLTISGGRYSFWNGTELQKISGTPMTYRLGLETGLDSGDETAYQAFTEAGNYLRCGVEADNGLNGVTMSWNFPDNPSMNGTYTLPNFMTTQEQLDSCVLYFEFIPSETDATEITGIAWRIVNASDTSTAVAQVFRMRFNNFEVWNYNEDKILNDRPRIWIEAGDNPEGVYNFSTPIKEAEICRVMTRLYTYDEEGEKLYTWDYYTKSEPNMYLWKRHASDASLVNGKSDYSNAKFSNVFFSIENSSPSKAEEKHFANTGSMKIPGGNYTLVNADTGETLGNVTGDTTLTLRFDSEGAIGADYAEYWPIDDSGKFVAFAGGAETGLNGKTITWTFPTALEELNGEGVIPNYKTTAEQLASGVPYIEVVSEDGYITAVNYKIVTSKDTATEIKPLYGTDFRFHFDHATGKDVWGNTYRSSWLKGTASGTYKLGIPQPVGAVKRIRVRLRSYEDTTNPAVYQWNFYPAEAPTPPTPPVPSDTLAITTASLPSGTVGTSYSATLASNRTGVRWSIIGSLPSGLSLNSSTGAITGTPLISGTSSFTVRAVSGTLSAEKPLSITISPKPTPTLTITTTSLPSGTVLTAYSATLQSSPSGAAWSISSGTLPAGLTLSSTGVISGIPITADRYEFKVRAVSGSLSAEKSLSITVNGQGGIKVGGGSSGGCESGLALSGVILLGFFLRKR
ncbi:MAG: putative Ig domain-containing protein [Synergistaceae bacterium]|nr:putative Ig domain-containing protein [Synergistaceae bacterium]